MTVALSLTLAFSLSMDAFAASLGKGAALRRPSVSEAMRIGIYFGAFEFALPLVGWALGSVLAGSIEAVDHWIAFLLLLAIGGRMSWHAFAGGGEAEGGPVRHAPVALMLTALATSVDATAVGITLRFMEIEVVTTVVLIGLVTFAMASGGVMVGRAVGARLGRWAEFAGGLGLVAIGTRILLDHTLPA